MEKSAGINAVKIALLAIGVTIVFGCLNGWMLLNHTTAIAIMSKEKKILEERVASLEAEVMILKGQKPL